ncbi:MAG: NAD(+) synthase [Eubacteriales bacterium]|nr:NAD(+) synthase [Eubacteriales bacterium]
MDHGFVRIAAAVPVGRVADCRYNAGKIAELARMASAEGAAVVVFPELSITAYTCGDLFHQKTLLDAAEKALEWMLSETASLDAAIIAGLPVRLDNQLFNCAVVFKNGKILGVIPKSYIPGYNEFYEERWFAEAVSAISRSVKLCWQEVPFGTDIIFCDRDDPVRCFGVEICEDLWMPLPPSSYQAMAGAVMLFNLSASNETIGKKKYRDSLIRQQSGRCTAAYAYASAGVGESTTDLVFAGHSMITEYSGVVAEGERFSREDNVIFADIDIQRLVAERMKNTGFMEAARGSALKDSDPANGGKGAAVFPGAYRKIMLDIPGAPLDAEGVKGTLRRPLSPRPFVPEDEREREARCREIFSIQTAGLAKRLEHTKLQKSLVAVSGGLDSTLALLVAAETHKMLKRPLKDIIAYTMPGFGTTNHTYSNAVALIGSLGAELREIDIKPACLLHFRDIGHDPGQCDVTYENVQARERTQVLMDAANKEGGLVLGTGDLSELALGWCTYNGDHMSMYSVNCGIPKTLVRYMVKWVADTIPDEKLKNVLYSIADTPISPELLPPDSKGDILQKTEDVVGPYELHDFFLYHAVRYGAPPAKIIYLASVAFKGVYGKDEIKKWLGVFFRRFFSQQFKRSCVPDGPKVGTVSLSPRGDWRMPSDAAAEEWLREPDE